MIVVHPEVYYQLLKLYQVQQITIEPLERLFGHIVVINQDIPKSIMRNTDRFIEYESGDDWAVWCGFTKEEPNVLIINDNNSSSRYLNLNQQINKLFGINCGRPNY